MASEWLRSRRGYLYVFGLGLLLALSLGRIAVEGTLLQFFGRKAKARVLSQHQPSSGGTRPSDVVFEYEFRGPDGAPVYGTNELAPKPAARIKRVVSVSYVSWRPQINRISGSVGILPTSLLALIAFMIVYPVFRLVRESLAKDELRIRSDRPREQEGTLAVFQTVKSKDPAVFTLFDDMLTEQIYDDIVHHHLSALDVPAKIRRIPSDAYYGGMLGALFFGFVVVVELACNGRLLGGPFLVFEVGLLFSLLGMLWNSRRYETAEFAVPGQRKVVSIPATEDAVDSLRRFVARVEEQARVAKAATPEQEEDDDDEAEE